MGCYRTNKLLERLKNQVRTGPPRLLANFLEMMTFRVSLERLTGDISQRYLVTCSTSFMFSQNLWKVWSTLLFDISTKYIISTKGERIWVSTAERSKCVGIPEIIMMPTLKFSAFFYPPLEFQDFKKNEAVTLISNLVIWLTT